ncbi:MAG TPA: siderophore-interacting protein [Myxococcota bacterium]|nr:siderophore-interacting protein [Myxococcota bacterium]
MRVHRVLDRFFLHGQVSEVEDVTPRMRRIRLHGESLRDLAYRPGQHVRVRVGEFGLKAFRDALRTYSVWHYDTEGQLDLCVLDHSASGPGARWARTVQVGQQVAFTKPEGRLVVQQDAPYHLFVGDETAAVPFGAMLRALPDSAKAAVVLEGDDRLPLPREATWVQRGSLIEALPDTPGFAYIAGEARTCQAVRRHLVQERNWPRKAIIVKAFWAPGKRGMD